jgi:hypothetical protein
MGPSHFEKTYKGLLDMLTLIELIVTQEATSCVATW